MSIRLDNSLLRRARARGFMAALALAALAPSLAAQERREVPMDTARARELYVSDRWEDHPYRDYQRDMDAKAVTDSTFAAVTAGVVDFQKVTYRSQVDGMEIPAYLFQPLEKRGPQGHAAMVWVHGGVHGNMTATYWPFIREAVERGYVIITPEYRGSTGFGEEHHNAIDYGGYEVDDAMSAYQYITSRLSHVDPERVGMMGWSHGGYITTLSLSRDGQPFKAGAAIVPVTNLVFRLSWKGPGYQRSFSTQQRITGLPFEEQEIYKERSPYYAVDNLNAPLLVHIATNDEDVDFEEASMLVYKLRDRKPDLTETKIYVDPAPWGNSIGHAFSRRVDSETLEPVWSPAMRDSWNRTWTFLEEHLRPYEDPSAEEGTSGIPIGR